LTEAIAAVDAARQAANLNQAGFRAELNKTPDQGGVAANIASSGDTENHAETD